ncbi:MAG: hypothetical protein Q9159_003161 [Coniocarpon cinnabarinum]
MSAKWCFRLSDKISECQLLCDRDVVMQHLRDFWDRSDAIKGRKQTGEVEAEDPLQTITLQRDSQGKPLRAIVTLNSQPNTTHSLGPRLRTPTLYPRNESTFFIAHASGDQSLKLSSWKWTITSEKLVEDQKNTRYIHVNELRAKNAPLTFMENVEEGIKWWNLAHDNTAWNMEKPTLPQTETKKRSLRQYVRDETDKLFGMHQREATDQEHDQIFQKLKRYMSDNEKRRFEREVDIKHEDFKPIEKKRVKFTREALQRIL